MDISRQDFGVHCILGETYSGSKRGTQLEHAASYNTDGSTGGPWSHKPEVKTATGSTHSIIASSHLATLACGLFFVLRIVHPS